MSERPFMQLYVSDYLGDTRHLSCEQHGAYLLLLMTMWNAGGSLPDDDAKLCRIVCLSLKKWRSIRSDLEPFFLIGNGSWSNKRLSEEFQKSESKSQSRSSAGERGGRAKALKNKEAAVAIVTVLPQHLPDTIKNEKEEPTGSSKKRGERLPENFEPDVDWAVSQGLSPAGAVAEVAKFRDYWRGKAQNATKLDWPATWRNWVRTAVERTPLARGSPSKLAPVDHFRNLASELNGQDRSDRGIGGNWDDAPRIPIRTIEHHG